VLQTIARRRFGMTKRLFAAPLSSSGRIVDLLARGREEKALAAVDWAQTGPAAAPDRGDDARPPFITLPCERLTGAPPGDAGSHSDPASRQFLPSAGMRHCRSRFFKKTSTLDDTT